MLLEEVQEIIDRAAYVCRRYALGELAWFEKELEGIDSSMVKEAWSRAVREIADDQIVRVAPHRQRSAFIFNGIIRETIARPEYKDDGLAFRYLRSVFDDSTLNLAEEDRQREIRRLLALVYFVRSRSLALETYGRQGLVDN